MDPSKPNDSPQEKRDVRDIDERAELIAKIAAKWIPPLDLPPDYLEIDPSTLRRTLKRPTDFHVYLGSLPIPYPHKQKDLTHFEVIAEEALARASILVDLAEGKRRPWRVKSTEKTMKVASEFRAAEEEEAKLEEQYVKWEPHYQRVAQKLGKTSLTFGEVLEKITLPKSQTRMIRRYLHAFLAEEFEQKPSDAVIDSLMCQERDCRQAWNLSRKIRAFYEERGEALRQKWNRESNEFKEAGKKGAKAKEKKTLAEAGKYGGVDSPDLVKIVKQAKSKKPRTSKRKPAKKGKK
tara:strand:- start:1041 stop:1919 length:879 start_codon:yes stop_codon:yes gene_type:complete